MYHRWLDRCDERRAQQGDAVKKPGEFVLDSALGFPGAEQVKSISAFCDLADRATRNPAFFDETFGDSQGFEREGAWLKFPSDVTTEISENNVVWSKITEGDPRGRVLVVFHHWNASSRQSQIASFFSKRGITVVEIAMPYHFERSRPGALHADYMLSANLGRTIQSVRQAVLDGRKLIRWLKSEGYDDVCVLGMSLGSWVAGLVAAHDRSVSKASLFLTAGSLADMVWTGRATRLIRNSIEAEIDLPTFRSAWRPLNLESYADKFARPDLDLQVILAKRDRVVLPELTEAFLQALKDTGVQPDVLRLNCGHYSLAMPPHILLAGLRLKRLLARGQ